jgi:uncharacterized protein YqjF (DUF2071 family)
VTADAPTTAKEPGSGPLAAAVRQASTLREVEHRPWPPPERTWVMAQTWEDLLFAHWRVPQDRLQELVPGLSVDSFDGDAWLGITPFVVTNLRAVGTPPAPAISTFPELNVRTYVTVDDKPGIYFFSLDAGSRLAVTAARLLYRLPYFRARMSVRRSGDWIEYESRRSDGRGAPAELLARYRSTGPLHRAEPGSLEYFLAERYCLYTVDPTGAILRAEIHHPPWPLQPAEAAIEQNSMPPPGFELPAAAPLLHYARRQDVLIWAPEHVKTR